MATTRLGSLLRIAAGQLSSAGGDPPREPAGLLALKPGGGAPVLAMDAARAGRLFRTRLSWRGEMQSSDEGSSRMVFAFEVHWSASRSTRESLDICRRWRRGFHAALGVQTHATHWAGARWRRRARFHRRGASLSLQLNPPAPPRPILSRGKRRPCAALCPRAGAHENKPRTFGRLPSRFRSALCGPGSLCDARWSGRERRWELGRCGGRLRRGGGREDGLTSARCLPDEAGAAAAAVS
eukprot:scaffold764_cov248-Pinguiococcus_pyrenoidosus.AAC.20